MTERRPHGRGRPSGKNPPPHFPDGCVIRIFDTAAAALQHFSDRPVIGHNFGRGQEGWVSLECDPDVLLGVEPSRFIDHTSRPWPRPLQDMIEWRASRAHAPVLKPIV